MRWQSCLVLAGLFVVFHHSYAGAATLNITSYGAVSGDATSDWNAINSAVSAAKSGDTVFIPAGNFSIDKTITLKNGVTLSGAGASSIVSFSGSGASMLKLSGNSNVQIASITFDGAGNSVGQGITADTSSGLNIHNVQIKNIAGNADFGPHGIYFSNSVTSSTVSSNTIANIGTSREWGAGIRLAWGSSGNTIAGNAISNTGRGGILADDGASNLVIRDNSITGSGVSGINGTGLGIEVWKSDRAIIQGNTVDHWISVDNSNGTAVRANKVSTSGSTKLAGLELVGSNDVVFSRNTVDGGAQLGISESNNGTQSTARTYLAHNLIKGSSTWGIQLLGGPSAGTNQQYFFANTFTKTATSTGHGFRFNGNAHNVVLDGNTISFNGGSALEFTGTNLNHLVFAKNSIHDNTGAPLTSNFNGTDIEWTSNTLSNNGSGPNAPTNTGSALNDPKLTLTAPTSIAPNVPVDFKIAFTPGAAKSPLSNVLWDFDEGLPLIGTSSTASYAFSATGTYTVGVVAWDADGRAAHGEVAVTVGVPEPAMALAFSIMAMAMSRRRTR